MRAYSQSWVPIRSVACDLQASVSSVLVQLGLESLLLPFAKPKRLIRVIREIDHQLKNGVAYARGGKQKSGGAGADDELPLNHRSGRSNIIKKSSYNKVIYDH